MPVAFICTLAPGLVSGKMGVTVMEVRTAEFMARVALPDIPPEVAVMFTVPRATPRARPELVTVARAGFEEVQVTSGVISKLDRSE